MRLDKILKEKCISQSTLAKMTGISEQSISRYVNGERVPNINSAAVIANALNVRIDELVYDNVNTKIDTNVYHTKDILLDACCEKVRELSQLYRIDITDSTKRFLISKEIELYQTIIPSFIISTLKDYTLE